jgi:transposase
MIVGCGPSPDQLTATGAAAIAQTQTAAPTATATPILNTGTNCVFDSGIDFKCDKIESMTIHLEISPEDLKEINYERYRHPVPLVQRRMEALWLKAHDLPHAQIATLVNISENSLRDYFRLYEEGGLEKVKEVLWYQPESELNGHVVSLEAHFQANPPASIKEAQSEIEALTGIKRSETQVREFLKKNSISVTGRLA